MVHVSILHRFNLDFELLGEVLFHFTGSRVLPLRLFVFVPEGGIYYVIICVKCERLGS